MVEVVEEYLTKDRYKARHPPERRTRRALAAILDDILEIGYDLSPSLNIFKFLEGRMPVYFSPIGDEKHPRLTEFFAYILFHDGIRVKELASLKDKIIAARREKDECELTDKEALLNLFIKDAALMTSEVMITDPIPLNEMVEVIGTTGPFWCIVTRIEDDDTFICRVGNELQGTTYGLADMIRVKRKNIFRVLEDTD